MKEVEKKDTPEISGGIYTNPEIPVIDPIYPQYPIGPIICPSPPPPPDEFVN